MVVVLQNQSVEWFLPANMVPWEWSWIVVPCVDGVIQPKHGLVSTHWAYAGRHFCIGPSSRQSPLQDEIHPPMGQHGWTMFFNVFHLWPHHHQQRHVQKKHLPKIQQKRGCGTCLKWSLLLKHSTKKVEQMMVLSGHQTWQCIFSHGQMRFFFQFNCLFFRGFRS